MGEPHETMPIIPLQLNECQYLLRCWRYRGSRRCCRGNYRRGRSRLQHHCHSRKTEASPNVVNDVDLADVSSRLQLCERDIELKGDRTPFGNVHRFRFHQRRLLDLHAAAQRNSILSQDADGAKLPPR